MSATTIHQGPAYELSLEVQTTRWGHHLRFVSFVPTARNPQPMERFQAHLSSAELLALREAIDAAIGLNREAHPTAHTRDSTEKAIGRFVEAWWLLVGGAKGATHMWLMSAKRQGLIAFLNKQLLECGRLPEGAFEFPYQFWGSKRSEHLSDELVLGIKRLLQSPRPR